MIFNPREYSLPDTAQAPFIDPLEIRNTLSQPVPTREKVIPVIEKALSLQRLTLTETATLLNAYGTAAAGEVLAAAGKLKEKVYGRRMVVFAPLYVGNRCINGCSYCGFRAGNAGIKRLELNREELIKEVQALVSTGQKRLILVWGEHPAYSPEAIVETVETVYRTMGEQHGQGGQGTQRINRININAAPLTVEGFRTVAASGIGTYQVFQETYDPELYRRVHPSGPKSDYDNRLTALDRAMQAGIDDVGIGALFGLGDWRFEVMGLVRHANHLEKCFGVGPHTVSVPRLTPSAGTDFRAAPVSDEQFIYLCAVLRLAIPYTGLIATARESSDLRDRLFSVGITQIDAGTRLEIGGYGSQVPEDPSRRQFSLGDRRPLEVIAAELVAQGKVPSFCTACYRKGRTGDGFMKFAVDGGIERFCTPNALLTFAEYLEDFASKDLKAAGKELIEGELAQMDPDHCSKLRTMLIRIANGERDLLL